VMNGLPARNWGPAPPAIPGGTPPDPGAGGDPGNSYAVGFGYGGAGAWQNGPGLIRGDQVWQVHDGELGHIIPKSAVQRGAFGSHAGGFGSSSGKGVVSGGDGGTHIHLHGDVHLNGVQDPRAFAKAVREVTEVGIRRNDGGLRSRVKGAAA
jgi:hypothetical protein